MTRSTGPLPACSVPYVQVLVGKEIEVGDHIGPYRVLAPIGKGGSGCVFVAVHEHMGQDVALKVLSRDAAEDPQLVARLLQEARALQQLEHPGIVRVYHCDKLEDGTVYLAMEHLHGVSLREWIRRGGAMGKPPEPAASSDAGQRRVALETALELGHQIAEAMVAVHEAGIVHRDLKPENVILVSDDTVPLGWRPKVLDFGIAKVPQPVDGERIDTDVQTAGPVVLGTVAYMAPEQCRSASGVTDRADVYALGVVLFELIAGRLPFDAAEPIELITMHVRDEPPRVQELVPDVPPGLDAFIAAMLAKDPAQRPTMERCCDVLARPWPAERHECPFPGLQPFTEGQAELFFGRRQETSELLAVIDELRDGSRLWLQVEGPSGAGKSSLVQAGLLPRIRSRPSSGKRWIVPALRPTDDPIRSLAAALIEADAEHRFGSRAEIEEFLRSDPGALAGLVDRWKQDDVLVLLVIEQLEELVALGTRFLAHFDALVATALTAPGSMLRLLTTLRSDYIHRLDQAPRLTNVLNSSAARYYLPPMSEDALAQVIHGMATRAGLRLSDGLAERMVRDAAGTEGRLPLLGHALRSLWLARAGALLTHEHYEQMGGVAGALARHAEALMQSLGEDGRERAKWLVLELVQVGRGAPDTRRPKTRGGVLAAAGGDSLAERVFMRLSGLPLDLSGEAQESLRLLVLSGDASTDPDQQRVDLVHETLLQQVPTLVAWIDAERALLERHADLEVAAHAWEQAGRPVEGLPSGSLLDHYRGYAQDQGQRARLAQMSSERARKFVRSAQRLESRRRRLRWGLVGALVVAVAAISISAITAVRERGRAEANRQRIILATEQVVSDADWKLGRLLYTLDARQKMLAHIDGNLSSLPEHEQANLDVIVAIVRTKHRRSDLARLNESLDRADEFVAGANGRILKGIEEYPKRRELQELLALNLSKRGKSLLARGRYEDARADFAQSVGLLLRMGEGDDDPSDYRRTLATSYSEQADVELELGRPSAAADLYDRTIELLEQNEGDYDRSLLALALTQRAVAARVGGDLATAATLLDRALSLEAPIVDGVAGNVYFRWILARIHAELAAVRLDEGRVDEAEPLGDMAIDAGEWMHRGDPTHKEYALLLCQALQGAEAVASARGDQSRAERARRRRCEVAGDLAQRDPDDTRFQKHICP